MDSKTSQQILDKVAEIKSAQNPLSVAELNKATREQAHSKIIQAFLLSGAAMGGIRGLQGLLNLAGRSAKEDVHHPGVTPVPIPIADEDEKLAGLRFGKGQARTIPWDQSDLNKELWEEGKIYLDDDDTPYYSHGSPLTRKLRLVDGMYRDFPGKGQFDPDHPRARDTETLELLARIKNIRGETAGPEYHSKDIIPYDEWENMSAEDWEALGPEGGDAWFAKHFEAKGFTDVQDAGDGNYRMKDPHGNTVEWDHETNSIFTPRWDPISELGEKQAQEAYQWWQHPEAFPGLMLGTLGGGYGGWKLMDSLLDRRRAAESEDELEAAKREYREALSSHLSSSVDTKAASEKSAATLLGEELDALFLKVQENIPLEKSADPEDGNLFGGAGRALGWLTSAPGKFYDWITKDTTRDTALGLYGAYSIPTLIAGYMAGKGISDKFSQRRILDKALKQRAKQRAVSRPPSLYAVPVDEEDES